MLFKGDQPGHPPHAAGASGRGKTLTAEAIAVHLHSVAPFGRPPANLIRADARGDLQDMDYLRCKTLARSWLSPHDEAATRVERRSKRPTNHYRGHPAAPHLPLTAGPSSKTTAGTWPSPPPHKPLCSAQRSSASPYPADGVRLRRRRQHRPRTGSTPADVAARPPDSPSTGGLKNDLPPIAQQDAKKHTRPPPLGGHVETNLEFDDDDDIVGPRTAILKVASPPPERREPPTDAGIFAPALHPHDGSRPGCPFKKGDSRPPALPGAVPAKIAKKTSRSVVGQARPSRLHLRRRP